MSLIARHFVLPLNLAIIIIIILSSIHRWFPVTSAAPCSHHCHLLAPRLPCWPWLSISLSLMPIACFSFPFLGLTALPPLPLAEVGDSCSRFYADPELPSLFTGNIDGSGRPPCLGVPMLCYFSSLLIRWVGRDVAWANFWTFQTQFRLILTSSRSSLPPPFPSSSGFVIRALCFGRSSLDFCSGLRCRFGCISFSMSHFPSFGRRL